jgi:acyl-CoA thioester hydrolase
MSRLHHWPIRIYWEDTDAGGVVFFANYVKFFERARTEWLRALGFSQAQLKHTHGGMFVVRDMHVRYHTPAQLDDALSVTTTVTRVGGASVKLHQSLSHAQSATALCDSTLRLGWVNAQRVQATRMPRILMEALNT